MSALGSIFTGVKPPPLPTPPPVALIPDPESPKLRAERRRRLDEERSKGGRESTDLSDSGSNQTYSNSTLGI